MHVDHAEPRNREQRVGQNLAVGRDDAKVGQSRRTVPRKASSLSRSAAGPACPRSSASCLGRRRRHVLPAALRPIGLRDTTATTSCREDRADDASVGTANAGVPKNTMRSRRSTHHFPARFSFWILRTMRSRLMPRSRSTKTAVEMIHLVLKRARQQARAFDGTFVAVAIEPLIDRSRRPRRPWR